MTDKNKSRPFDRAETPESDPLTDEQGQPERWGMEKGDERAEIDEPLPPAGEPNEREIPNGSGQYPTPDEFEQMRQEEHLGSRPYPGEQWTDEQIQSEVVNRLAQARQLVVEDLEVSVSDGVVRLTGTVQDEENLSQPEEIARTVPGVLDVDNQMSVT